ncbi:MAG: transposase [Betaproteobacteria bacterium]|nr:transposase [Betaproteobacteria bacterium]
MVQRADNSAAESLNARIQRIKSRAYGFRNRESLRKAIYFHLGGLQLYPKGINEQNHPLQNA